jgi:hypothetical protein
LYLLGNFKFLRCASLRFELSCVFTPAAVQFASRIVKACEGKCIAIRIDKAAEHPAPTGRLRWNGKMNAPPGPFQIFRFNILSQKSDDS